MRIPSISALVAISVTVSLCSACGLGGEGSPTAPTGPPAGGSTIVYSAVGASDVMGIGSSKECFLFEDCDGKGYVWAAARQLRAQAFTVNVSSLGVPTAVLSRSMQDLGEQIGRVIAGNLIQSEMAFVKQDATLVTVFAGGNDVNVITGALGKGAGGSDPTGFIDARVATFASDYVELISGIRARAPRARLVVLNLPNLAGAPYLASETLAQKQAAQRTSVRMTTTAINTLAGVTVVDLMCDARVYLPSFYSTDGFHPSDVGHAIMGSEVVNALTSSSYAAPRSSCAQMTLF